MRASMPCQYAKGRGRINSCTAANWMRFEAMLADEPVERSRANALNR